MSSSVGALTPFINNPSSSTLPTDSSTQDYKSQFLKLLLVQLRNQDPTAPFDSQKMLADQAQFASLEQMQNMNTNFVTLMAMQNVAQGTNLIGKAVVATDKNGVAANGQVTGIRFENGVSILKVDTGGGVMADVLLSNVTEVNL